MSAFLRCLIAGATASLIAGHAGESDPLANALARRLDELGQRIAAMERTMSATHGRGAFARGPTLRIDGGGESLLQRLHRLECDLAAHRALLAGRDRELALAHGRIGELTASGTAAAQRIAGLEHTADQLVTARQVLAERQTALDAALARQSASELARLRAEQAYCALAAAILRLTPNQPSALNDLQDLVRTEVRAFMPERP